MQCPLKQTSCTFCNSWMHQLLCSKRSTVNPSNIPCCGTACRPDSPWWWGHLQGQGHLKDNLEAVSWAFHWVRWQVLHTLRPCIKKHMHWHVTRTQSKLFACQHNTGLWPMTMILKPGGASWPVDPETSHMATALLDHYKKCTTNCASSARSTASH